MSTTAATSAKRKADAGGETKVHVKRLQILHSKVNRYFGYTGSTITLEKYPGFVYPGLNVNENELDYPENPYNIPPFQVDGLDTKKTVLLEKYGGRHDYVAIDSNGLAYSDYFVSGSKMNACLKDFFNWKFKFLRTPPNNEHPPLLQDEMRNQFEKKEYALGYDTYPIIAHEVRKQTDAPLPDENFTLRRLDETSHGMVRGTVFHDVAERELTNRPVRKEDVPAVIMKEYTQFMEAMRQLNGHEFFRNKQNIPMAGSHLAEVSFCSFKNHVCGQVDIMHYSEQTGMYYILDYKTGKMMGDTQIERATANVPDADYYYMGKFTEIDGHVMEPAFSINYDKQRSVDNTLFKYIMQLAAYRKLVMLNGFKVSNIAVLILCSAFFPPCVGMTREYSDSHPRYIIVDLDRRLKDESAGQLAALRTGIQCGPSAQQICEFLFTQRARWLEGVVKFNEKYALKAAVATPLPPVVKVNPDDPPKRRQDKDGGPIVELATYAELAPEKKVLKVPDVLKPPQTSSSSAALGDGWLKKNREGKLIDVASGQVLNPKLTSPRKRIKSKPVETPGWKLPAHGKEYEAPRQIDDNWSLPDTSEEEEEDEVAPVVVVSSRKSKKQLKLDDSDDPIEEYPEEPRKKQRPTPTKLPSSQTPSPGPPLSSVLSGYRRPTQPSPPSSRVIIPRKPLGSARPRYEGDDNWDEQAPPYSTLMSTLPVEPSPELPPTEVIEETYDETGRLLGPSSQDTEIVLTDEE
jgi:hypothetical protein